jgi:hypothetical protein
MAEPTKSVSKRASAEEAERLAEQPPPPTTLTQLPGAPSAEVQVTPGAQPFPSSPRQPGTHSRLSLQIMPEVSPPQSWSVRQPTHWPMTSSGEVQKVPSWQPLPDVPRQPGLQIISIGSHTIPLVAPPQSLSILQSPQRPVGAQTSMRQENCIVQVSPAGRPHVPSPSKHSPERHCASFVGVQVVPFDRPHLLSVGSHTPLSHTRAPVSCVQVPAWSGIVAPFGSFGVHTPDAHHSLVAQSLSVVQPLPQLPID